MKTFIVPKGTFGIIAQRREDNMGVSFSAGEWLTRKDVVVEREDIITDPVSAFNRNDSPDESVVFQLMNPDLNTVIRQGDYYLITNYRNLEMSH